MTGKTITVSAEWALHGKSADDRGYHILQCSNGDLTRGNFEEALDRFDPGTLDALPQVSVNYLRRGDEGGSYLALAIREIAAGHRDADGREIILTRYFCVPYAELAPSAVTYHAMYEAANGIQLPAGAGPPLEIELAVTAPQVPSDELARQVAALLLSGSPVCVLGADGTGVDERVRFIDAAMSMLPYGMRSRMSASTWTRSTFQQHRFRLFFSDAPRADDADHVVTWRQPGQTVLPSAHRHGHDYLAWLEGQVRQPAARLAALTEEIGFGAKQVLQTLELVGVAGAGPDLGDPADRQRLRRATRAPGDGDTYGEALLVSCAERMRTLDLSGLKSDITALRKYAEGHPGLGEEDRYRYQEVVWRNGLLSPAAPVGGLAEPFYDALLRLAFGVPLRYASYCRLEDCLGTGCPPAQPPHRALLEAIERAGQADVRGTAIVRWHLGEDALDDWLTARKVQARDLIDMLADDWDRPHHARIMCDITMRYLRTTYGQYEQRALRTALRDRGHLAQALQAAHAADPEYQVKVLCEFLHAAYGSGPNRQEIASIMIGTGSPPTPALLAAVLLLASPADADMARDAYVTALLALSSFSAATRARLMRHLPVSVPAPAREHAPEPASDR
jgi:hypothetical protein